MIHDDFDLSPADLAMCNEIPGVPEEQRDAFLPDAQRLRATLLDAMERIHEFVEQWPDYVGTDMLAGIAEFTRIATDGLEQDAG